MIAEQLLYKLSYRYFQWPSGAGPFWQSLGECNQYTVIQDVGLYGFWERTANMLHWSTPVNNQGKIFPRWSNFSATSNSEACDFRCQGILKYYRSLFFYYGNRCVQVAQWFLEYLQFCTKEIHHGSVCNRDHKSVRHVLSFCSCRSLAITECQNTTSIL